MVRCDKEGLDWVPCNNLNYNRIVKYDYITLSLWLDSRLYHPKLFTYDPVVSTTDCTNWKYLHTSLVLINHYSSVHYKNYSHILCTQLLTIFEYFSNKAIHMRKRKEDKKVSNNFNKIDDQ